MDDLQARAALRLGVGMEDLYQVVLSDDTVIVIYADYRKVRFPAAELPELPVVETAGTTASVDR